MDRIFRQSTEGGAAKQTARMGLEMKKGGPHGDPPFTLTKGEYPLFSFAK